MEKEMFRIVCDYKDTDDGVQINFSIEGNQEAGNVYDVEAYEKYLKQIVKIVKPVTKEMSDLTNKFLLKQKLKNIPCDELLKKLFESFKDELKGE